MKKKERRVLEQIEALNGNVHWTDVEALMVSMGAEVHEREGSKVIIILDGRPFRAHRPHPRKDCGTGLVKRVRAFLKACGRI